MTHTPRLPEGCTLVALDSIGSTNDHAKMLARKGDPAGTVIWAKAQTAGRGRQGNVWASLPGNLFMTLILKPETSAAQTGQLSFLAAVALSRTLRPFLPEGEKISLKWPNDLLINGKKAAGILIETELSGTRPVPWVVLGIGVNITSAPEGAGCLSLSVLALPDAASVLEPLVAHIMDLYAVWKRDGFAAIREEWLGQAAGVGHEIRVRLPKETFYGTFLGIDSAGALQITMPDGSRRTVISGEVLTG
jgi:BirA family biotin operon repressor/biotin-[acetyl-CoA-carboxylase] ligase